MTKKIRNLGKIVIKNGKHIVVGIGIAVCVSVIAIWMNASHASAGWKYVFDDDLALSKSNPHVFHSLSFHESSLYISNTNGFTYNLDRVTGALRWRHEAQNYSIFQPAVGSDGLIYFSNSDGHLYTVDKKTGKEIWRFTTPEWYKADTEPILSNGVVLFGSRNGILYAFASATGKELWKYQVQPVDISRYTPDEILIHFGRMAVDDDRVYVNSATENSIIAIDLKTGKERWRFPHLGYTYDTPIVIQNRVIFRNNENIYYALDSSNGNVIFQKSNQSQHFLQGDSNSYFFGSDNYMEAIDTKTGALRWTYKNKQNNRPMVAKEHQSKNLVLATHEDTNSLITFIDAETGNPLWNATIKDTIILSVLTDQNTIYAIGDTTQCAYSVAGDLTWCSHEKQTGDTAFLTHKGMYTVSDDSNLVTITLIDIQTGHRVWRYQSSDINISSMQVYEGNMYFISKDNKGLYMLNGNNRKSEIQKNDITVRHDTSPYSSQAADYLKTFLSPLMRTIRAITHPTGGAGTLQVIAPPSAQIKQNTIYELTIPLEESQYKNKYDSVTLTGIFSNSRGETYKTTAFYFDKNTWKMRFNPPESGNWTWNITLTTYTGSLSQRGSFEVTESEVQGFISISPKNSKLFITPDNNIFTPIGIQDCVEDRNQDGNPINQWFPGIQNAPQIDAYQIPAVPMDTYFATHRDSGFNLFRWGSGNCSFTLWKSLSANGNRYAVDSGIWLDTLYSSLRNHKYHIWMSLFSFKLPFDTKLPQSQQREIVKRYLDYVVARYAAYIDVWEISNEINIDDAFISYMSSYIRSIDPYHHPITVNWPNPNVKEIDIVSIHWYSQECNLFCDADLKRQIASYQEGNKPIVFSEQGNVHANWDYLSGTRMRVLLWIGFFHKVSYIFWNSSRFLLNNSINGTSNLYIGPEERQYVTAFKNFISNLEDTLAEYPAHSTKPEDRVFAFSTKREIIGYIFHQVSAISWKATKLVISVPASSRIQWINTSTGAVITEHALPAGDQVLQVPEFSTDIAFKIRYDTQESN